MTNGANASLFNNVRSKPIDVATPPVSKMLEEEDPARGDSDVESQLLEAAKNGDLVTIKVSMGEPARIEGVHCDIVLHCLSVCVRLKL